MASLVSLVLFLPLSTFEDALSASDDFGAGVGLGSATGSVGGCVYISCYVQVVLITMMCG